MARAGWSPCTAILLLLAAVVGSRAGIVRPKLLLIDGCSGSTYIQGFAACLLDLHGERTKATYGSRYSNNEREPLNFLKPLHVDDSVTPPLLATTPAGLRRLCARAAAANETLVFNVQTWALRWLPELVPSLHLCGARMVSVARANALDQVVCLVKDCFDRTLGHPVDREGRNSSICTARRARAPEERHLAQLRVAGLMERLQSILDNGATQHSQLESAGFGSRETLLYEDLAAATYTDAAPNVKRSLSAWSALLAGWGVQPHAGRIRDAIRSTGSRRTPPPPHAQVIQNHAEVRQALAARPELLRRLWRDPAPGVPQSAATNQRE